MDEGITMAWLRELDAPTGFEAVLGHRPELLARFRDFYAAIWSQGLVPRRVLEVCRLRIAAIHDCEAEWNIRDATVDLDAAALAALRSGRFEGFDADEQAALAVAELMPFGHHQVGDDDVARLQSMLGARGAVALLTAIAFFDVVCRLKLVLDVGVEPHALGQPPLRAGSLV
jgi:hypothetical protein